VSLNDEGSAPSNAGGGLGVCAADEGKGAREKWEREEQRERAKTGTAKHGVLLSKAGERLAAEGGFHNSHDHHGGRVAAAMRLDDPSPS
jgi:hypothetical protein